jgi:hypothetical protein
MPTVDDCFDRLRRAGWSVGETAYGTVWLVSGTNGENRIQASTAQIAARTVASRANSRTTVSAQRRRHAFMGWPDSAASKSSRASSSADGGCATGAPSGGGMGAWGCSTVGMGRGSVDGRQGSGNSKPRSAQTDRGLLRFRR